jgi:ankyrin repeat protein
MQTTRDVQSWFSHCGVWIEADDILWYWSKGTLWFIVVDQPGRSMVDDTIKGYVSIAHTHNKDGSPIRFFELHDEIPIEEAPSNFRTMLKSYGSASGVRQAEQLTEVFYQTLKSETAQQKFHLNDLAESLSAVFSNVEIKQCQKEARVRLEDENYDELDLIKAILGGNIDAVEKCIVSGSYELDSTYSPLQLAAISGISKMVTVLIDGGADVNQSGSGSQTALHLVASFEMDDPIASVTALIEAEADVNAIDSDRMTPLHIASLNGRDNIVKLLIKADAAIDCRDKGGNTPLHLAAENGHSEIVAMLIKSEARLNITNDEDSTPLACAMEMDYPEIVEMLVHAGAYEFVRASKGIR